MTGSADDRPPELRPYLDGLATGELLVPRCANCERTQWPPRPRCRWCRHQAFEWITAPSGAQLYSWTVTHRAPEPSFTGLVPYTLVIVAVPTDPPVRMLGRMIGSGPAADEVTVGMRLEPVIQRQLDGRSLVLWRAETAPAS